MTVTMAKFTLLYTIFICIVVALVAQPPTSPSMVYILNRHGVREPRDTSSYEGGARLLSSAYDRLYRKGQHIRSLYPILSASYNPSEIRVNSSAWERTINTAHGILAGLYNTNITMKIPVYSSPWESDFTLYNYDKCVTYDNAWSSFLQTAEWNNKVQHYANLTSYLNSYLQPSTKITLATIYSTWDLHWIQRNRPEVGIITKPLDDYTYNQLTEAAHWVETVRYGSRVSGSLLGSTFLTAVKYRMDRFIANDKTFGHKMIISSAHYPTMLSVLSSMGYVGSVSQSIPDYNSLLAFELWNTSVSSTTPSGWGVRIVYHNGDWNGVNDTSVPIALQQCTEGNDCMIDFATFWSNVAGKNLRQWCVDCASKIDMCLYYTNASASPSGATPPSATTTVVSTDVLALPISTVIAVWLILGLVVVSVAMTCVFQCISRPYHRHVDTAHPLHNLSGKQTIGTADMHDNDVL